MSEGKDVSKELPLVSRRNFLKGLLSTAVAPIVPKAKELQTFNRVVGALRSGETESIRKPLAVFVDFANTDPAPLLERVLGSSEVLTQLQPDSDFYKRNWSETYLRSSDPEIVRAVMLIELFKEKKGHADMVSGAYEDFVRSQGGSVDNPMILPIIDAIDIDFITNVEQNPLNNPMADLIINERKVGDILDSFFQEHPEQKIVNFSAQIGKMERMYGLRSLKDLYIATDLEDTNLLALDPTETWNGGMTNHEGKVWPYILDADDNKVFLELVTEDEYDARNADYHQTSISEFRSSGHSDGAIENTTYDETTIEAYNAVFARENLIRLSELCNRFPDKLFITAGGNENDRFFEIRERLEHEGVWPKNLIIVGAQNPVVGIQADGCDIYIKATDYKTDRSLLSASESTAMISGAVDDFLQSDLNNPRLSPEQIRQTFFEQYTLTDEYHGKNPTTNLSVNRTGRFLLPPDQIPGGYHHSI